MQLYNLPFAADNIARFMAYYRSQFPTATVTPKLHMLEEHVPWIKRWGMGFGLLGEQGAESIHAYFNPFMGSAQLSMSYPLGGVFASFVQSA